MTSFQAEKNQKQIPATNKTDHLGISSESGRLSSANVIH